MGRLSSTTGVTRGQRQVGPCRAASPSDRSRARSPCWRTQERNEELMRITGVRVDIVDLGRANALYVRIDTDRDLTGTGETILKRRDRSVEANLREIGEYLVGKEALAIEDHFEKLYRDTFWLGGPLHAA